MASENQNESGNSAGYELKPVSRLRRFGTQMADRVRLALGRETMSGVAEANALEDETRNAALEKTHKPSILDEIDPAKSDLDQKRQLMAALGSEKHLRDWSDGFGGNKRNATLVGETDARSLRSKLNRPKRYGMVAPADLKDLTEVLDPQPQSLRTRSSRDSWQSGLSIASTLNEMIRAAPAADHTGNANMAKKPAPRDLDNRTRKPGIAGGR